MKAWTPTIVLLVLPVIWVLSASAAFGGFSVDLAGHLWMGWHASREALTTTTLLAAPDGLDLMPVLGGWLDVWLVGRLHALGVPLESAYNVVIGLYLVVAGIGGTVLARAADVRLPFAVLAGLLLQCDGFMLEHLMGGRPEQVGLGFVALALGVAGLTWKDRLHPAWCGVLGALVLFVSWELSLLTVLALVWMTPWMLPAKGERAAVARRMGVAAGVALAVAGWWVVVFLLRTGAVRDADEGTFALETARRASVGLLSWFGPGTVRPGWLVLGSLVLLRGRAGLGVAVGLALTLLLALGPGPGLFGPSPGSWGPFVWMQEVPVLGWFHWPDRLLAVWSLAACVCAARLADRLAARHVAMAVGAAVVLVGTSLAEQRARWPHGVFRIEPQAHAQVLAAGEGVILDLPIQADPVHHLDYMLLQVTHQRPIVFNMVLSHLSDEQLADRVAGDPVLAWFAALQEPRQPEPPDWQDADLDGLRADGVTTIVLHARGWPRDRHDLAVDALSAVLGPPETDRDGGVRRWAVAP
ncbi:MAG: hypothetical protein GY913_05210 [Proteobacteria bacterium]|nr:hypothetical protein [Pseudomonadota bacterium]MCP4916300.1 hypothetical protein [Pseudomonadota bacterium]